MGGKNGGGSEDPQARDSARDLSGKEIGQYSPSGVGLTPMNKEGKR